MLKENDLSQIKESYIKIGKTVQKYGGECYNGVLEEIMAQIRCIDSKEDILIKTEYLCNSFSSIFSCEYGIGNFIIYVKDKEDRIRLNEDLYSEINKISTIISERG